MYLLREWEQSVGTRRKKGMRKKVAAHPKTGQGEGSIWRENRDKVHPKAWGKRERAVSCCRRRVMGEDMRVREKHNLESFECLMCHKVNHGNFPKKCHVTHLSLPSPRTSAPPSALKHSFGAPFSFSFSFSDHSSLTHIHDPSCSPLLAPPLTTHCLCRVPPFTMHPPLATHPPSSHVAFTLATDAPEPKACAYLSSSPAGPTLEWKQGHPHLKAWARDPTLPKQSPKVQDTWEHSRAPQDASDQSTCTTHHPQPQKPSQPLQEPQYHSL